MRYKDEHTHTHTHMHLYTNCAIFYLQELKLQIIKGCLDVLVERLMIPYSGWRADVAKEPLAKPDIVHWNVELRNTTGECVCETFTHCKYMYRHLFFFNSHPH